jgi:hypothetical protein
VAVTKVATYEPRYRDQLLAFLGRAFAEYPHKSLPAYFDWMFGGNPLGSSLDAYMLLLEDDRVIGQMGTMRDRLRINGEWVDVRWVVDLNIDPAHRGGLGARQLFKRAMASARVVLATGVATHVLPIYEGLGWTRLSPVRSRYCVFRPSRLLAIARATERAPSASPSLLRLLRVADHVLPAASRAQAALLRLSRNGTPVHEVVRFESAWDADIRRLLEVCGVTEDRSVALLNWRFVERPLGRHRIFVLPSRDEGVRGMMALKWMARAPVARWLEVADYLVAPDDGAGFRRLADHVVAVAAASGLDFVRFRVSHPTHVGLLRRPVWLDHTRPINDDVFVFTREHDLLTALRSSPWHLTALASDRNETGRDEWPG